MLVLAGMITLSIIGAIAAIPSGSLPPDVRFERETWRDPQPPDEPLPAAGPGQPAQQGPGTAAGRPTRNIAVAPAPQKRVEAADWLEAIAYALLAVAGLAALAIILLWRALIQWRRSADALEALATRPLENGFRSGGAS